MVEPNVNRTLLAIDTSSATGSIAVANVMEAKVSHLHEVTWEKRASHSEVATVKLSKLLEKASVSLAQITHITVNIGPGSFTGIRVGLSLARSLAYSLNVPLLGVNSLENLALANGREGETVFVALKAVQNFFYYAAYRLESKEISVIKAPQSAASLDLQPLSQGSTKVLIESITPTFTHKSDAPGLIQYVARFPISSVFSAWNHVEPLYIRGSEAEEKLKRGLLRPL